MHHLPSFSTIKWPHQPPPSRKAFNAWRKIIRKTFLSEKQGRSRNMKLEAPLGKFYNMPRHRTWQWEWDGTNIVTQKFIAETLTITLNYQATVGRSVMVQKAKPIAEVPSLQTKQTIPLKMIQQTSGEISFRKERVALSDTRANQQQDTRTNWERNVARNHVTIDPTDEAELWHSNDTDFCIGVCAKKSGEQATYGWSIASRTGGLGRITKLGVGKVPKTNQHDTLCTGEL
jgi:hypothetical protein